MTSLSFSLRSFPCLSPLPTPRIALSPLRNSGFAPGISTIRCSRGLRCLRVRSMAAIAGTERKKAVEVFDTEEELAASFAEYTARLSENFVKKRGAFSVVLSGGSLVKSLRFRNNQAMCTQSMTHSPLKVQQTITRHALNI